jgi:hypothetical protein
MTYSILTSSKQLQSVLEAIALLAIALGFLLPRFGTRWYRTVESRLGAIARHPGKAILIAGALPMAIRVLLLPLFPIPKPYVHDEFSYLLMADTFAHGRVSNPVPPEWKHFEAEYVLLQPSYASQYQPGQGVVLAAGQLITGQPWWGVWASVGLMCGILYWALGSILPRGWALFGAFAAALQFGIFGFWMNSYFGGALTACGGALVFGALLRMRRKPVSSSVLCGAGLILIFATRPAEAALWGLIASIWIVTQNRKFLFRSIAPGAAVCAFGFAVLAYYDYRVTDHPLEPPYLEGRANYGTPQSFWWQPAVTVSHFDNPQLRDNYLNQLAFWDRRTSVAALWDSTWRRARDFWRFFIGPFLTVPLFFLVCLWRDRKMRPWLIASALFILDHATYHAWYPQQSASETVLIVLLLTQCWRHLRAWNLTRETRRRHCGLAISRNLVAASLVAVFLIAGARAADLVKPGGIPAVRKILAPLLPAMKPRDRVIQELNQLPGKQLVFVYYPPDHPYIDEWVFNGADIPGDRIVFSRLVDTESDSALIRAMPGYTVWLVDSDSGQLVRPAGSVHGLMSSLE